MQVLLVKTSSMGDVLHTLPALTEAMNAHEKICFDWVIEENFVQIPTWHPAVDKVIPVAIRRWRQHWFRKSVQTEWAIFKQALQKKHYDVVIDAQGLLKSAALITRLACGIKHGFDRQSAREAFASAFYHQRHRVDKNQHAVERLRDLLAKSLGYSKSSWRGDYAISSAFVSKNRPHDPYLILIHSTTQKAKHWPELHWRALIEEVIKRSARIKIKLPWGTEPEYQRACRLAEGFSQVEVLPHCDLQAIAHILTAAQAVVSVDTGLSHLAAALGKPNLTLFGPTDPLLIGGYGDHQISIVSETKNMADLFVDEIMAVLKQHIL
ncbi:lipopolysaccharide heptosyltransferase RfaC [Candidatus Williamhamiltonella defendens]|uniref:lipopolysaccharide heptosyltransferase RfaC n=1 Tax=Candidatus Williamhamiltonella defendens TaxID=138072 RepID=UPI00130E7684|nr:lipopolysaccharide heptosyltransferase RfaC [Candidatus Hamiltonella defensa]